MSKLKIALLSGGTSGEREVSIKTGDQIFEALDKAKYEIFRYDTRDDLKAFFNDAMDKKFDLIFPVTHGPFGEDGKLQGLIDMTGVPYLFSGCLASALAMNKRKTKVIVKEAGVNVAPDLVVCKKCGYNINAIISKLGFPIVIKPMELGSSVGMSIAQNEDELNKGIEEALKWGEEALLEKFIKGRELTCAVMGNEEPIALPIVEIKPKISQWFDFKAKYEPGGSEEICPAQVPENIKNAVQDYAKKAFKAVGCRDLARADFIWDENTNEIYFIEINTIPGMTSTSLAPQTSKAAGMEFSDFLDKLIEGIKI